MNSPAHDQPLAKIDISVPHSARIWNYWLGGKDNYEVDRAAGDQYLQVFPQIAEIARADRAFLGRAVRYLTGEVGIRQLLDIGTGLPTVDNTHEVAQRVAPECHIVYVDNDPLVLAHARALLTSDPRGATDYIDADMRDPAAIAAAAARLLDFTQPIALMFMGVLGHIDEYDHARAIVDQLVDVLAPGSYLAIYDGTSNDQAFNEAQQGYDDTGAVPYRLRTPEQIAGYFHRLDLVEPGVVSVERWRPEATSADPPAELPSYAAVGRKP